MILCPKEGIFQIINFYNLYNIDLRQFIYLYLYIKAINFFLTIKKSLHKGGISQTVTSMDQFKTQSLKKTNCS